MSQRDKTRNASAYFRAYHAQRMEVRTAIIVAAKARPCADCGVEYPTHVMQFDHVRGVKLGLVSRMKDWNIRRLTDEIAKCEVVCANCHSDRTFTRYHAGVAQMVEAPV